MYTIALINQKGGAGKTTLTVNLAQSLDNSNGSSVIFDMDPQGSALQWADARGSDTPPEVLPVFPVQLAKMLDTVRAHGASALDETEL